MDQLLIPAYPDGARVIGIGKTKLYELLDEGAIESVVIGRRRLLVASSLEAYVDRLVAEQAKPQPVG